MIKKRKIIYMLFFITILLTLFKISYNIGKSEGLELSIINCKKVYIQGFNDAIETYEYNK